MINGLYKEGLFDEAIVSLVQGYDYLMKQVHALLYKNENEKAEKLLN